MTVGTLYYSVEKGEPLRTRAIFPYSLIKYFNIDVELGTPDEHFPSEFPAKKVPSFRYSSGETLTESIPVSLMRDGSSEDYARILSWLNLLNVELMDSVAVQFTMLVGRKQYEASNYELAGRNVDRQLQILEDHLTKNTYLVGEKVSLADLYGVPMLLRGLQHLWGPEYRAKFPAVIRWFETVSRSSIFAGFFDNVEFTSESKKPQN